MRRRLRGIYWRGILLTLVMALAAVAVTAKVKLDDTRDHLTSLLAAAGKWTMDSNDDFQSLADAISGVSPQVRVTFMLRSGLVLADSAREDIADQDHYADPEIAAARRGETGHSLRVSATRDALVMYMARRLSPQLILRLSYPVFGIARVVLTYGALLLFLFLALYLLERRAIARLVADQQRQFEDVCRLLDGEADAAVAVFPEYQPALDAVAYRARRLRDDYEEIQRTLRLRSDFVANASHELRSPLTSVRGYAELLQQGMADTPEERALCLDTILGECDRMLAVIEDILRLSRAERPAEPEAPRPARPVALEIARALLPRTARRRIDISIEGEADVPLGEKALWELMYNLMDNAVRYGREGGHVWVRLSGARVEVADDGIGIDGSQLQRIFEQFYRVDAGRDGDAGDTGGTGLGLSIVRALVEGAGGTVRAESVPGQGSRFIAQFGGEG